MNKTGFKVKKKDLSPFLEGHRKAEKLIKAEKKKRLSQLTNKDSIREYDYLCKAWEANTNKEGIESLEKQKISFLLKRRRLFDKAGRFMEERNKQNK
jgi:hypothetical protein